MIEEKKHFTRLGDGFGIYMTEEEIRKDIESGTTDAANRGKISKLTEGEKEKIFSIMTDENTFVSVQHGRQVVSSTDQGCYTLSILNNIPVDRAIQAQILERGFCLDSSDFGSSDYNYKSMKNCANYEANNLEFALDNTIIPLMYGAMPNLGYYTHPDGPVENWSELLPQGKIKEALAAQEKAVEHSVEDIVYVADQMYEAGADGMNLDTCGASGDADFLASLKACEEIRRKHPGMGVEIGMAGEFVLGMHGKLKYNDQRLAGMYPHKQVKVCEEAGATIFGAVVNTNTSKSFPWNIARVCTFMKETVNQAGNIAVHCNLGMGVGGTPMAEIIPSDSVSRATKCLVEICNIDGL